jgi:hypothetical protein
MITTIVFIVVWCCLNGNGAAIREMTPSQQAIFILIAVASDLNFIFNRK